MLIGQMENEEPQLGLMDQDENSQLVKKVGKTYEQRRFIFQEDCSTYHIEPDTKVAKRRLCDQAFLINCSSQGLGKNPIEHKYLEVRYIEIGREKYLMTLSHIESTSMAIKRVITAFSAHFTGYHSCSLWYNIREGIRSFILSEGSIDWDKCMSLFLKCLESFGIEHYGDYDALEINQNLGIVKEIYMRAQSVDLQGMVELSQSPF
ncbi:hypothetical protein J3Q64DRAFT_1704738 [Phycomyces blakesleeanus]|uniref:Fungal-type protein kinase domain-containing protein n=1 Tax=Phycomyces blakesleeanus TaxID=4837 RepID=A0ABR3AHR2_PHYBL